MEDLEKEGLLPSPPSSMTMAGLSRSSRVALLAAFGGQLLSAVGLVWKPRVEQLPLFAILLTAIGAGISVVAASFAIYLAPSAIGRKFRTLLLIVSWTWQLLLCHWLVLFSQTIRNEIQDVSDSMLNNSVLSGFSLLLVFSQDVFGALGHIVEAGRLPGRWFVLIVSVMVLMLGTSVAFHVFGNEPSTIVTEPSALFEIATTLLILLLHLCTGLMNSLFHSMSRCQWVFDLVFTTIAMMAMIAAFALAFFHQYDAVADIIHRCTDVALLMESSWLRQIDIRRKTAHHENRPFSM